MLIGATAGQVGMAANRQRPSGKTWSSEQELEIKERDAGGSADRPIAAAMV